MSDENTTPNLVDKSEETKDWVEEELNKYTNLKNPGAHNIGKVFFVSYEDENKVEKKCSGIVVASYESHLLIQDLETNQINVIDTNNDRISSIKSNYIGQEQPSFRYPYRGEMSAALHNGSTLYGLCAFKSEKGGEEQYFLLVGSMKEKLIHGYGSVLEVTDLEGISHILDLQLVPARFALTSRKDELTVFVPSTKQPLEIIDHNRTERIHLAETLLEELPGINILDNPSYYRYFESDIDRTKDILHRWYGYSADKMVQTLEDEIGVYCLPLLADPGIAQRFDQFIDFVRGIDTYTSLEYMDIRNMFKEYLGYKTVYRGMMLDETELSTIKNNGLYARALLDKRLASRVIEGILDEQPRYLYTPYARDYQSHVMGRLSDYYDFEYSILLSVSSYRPVSESVGFYNSGFKDNPNKSLYVFECCVPELSLIRMENLFKQDKPLTTKLKIGDLILDEKRDLEVEMFLPYIIPSLSITNIEKVTSPPEKWIRID